jgi:hypothetical protein
LEEIFALKTKTKTKTGKKKKKFKTFLTIVNSVKDWRIIHPSFLYVYNSYFFDIIRFIAFIPRHMSLKIRFFFPNFPTQKNSFSPPGLSALILPLPSLPLSAELKSYSLALLPFLRLSLSNPLPK